MAQRLKDENNSCIIYFKKKNARVYCSLVLIDHSISTQTVRGNNSCISYFKKKNACVY